MESDTHKVDSTISNGKHYSIDEKASQDNVETVPLEGEVHMTRAKWLACFALGLSYSTAFQQGACLGAIVKSIDEALGPTTYYNWLLSAGTITSSIALPLSGGLSDIFGRRWFIIAGCLIAFIAHIIALAAKNIPTLIASAAFAGFGSGSQQLSLAATAELVPNKYRGNVQAVLDLTILPWSVFGSLTGGAMVTYHGKYGFRINFVIGVVLNAVCLILTYIWYHPPSSGPRLGDKTKMQAFKALDWSGCFLLNVGLLLLLVGISVGGTKPWNTAPTLAPFIVGAVSIIIFGFWEWKVAKFPFMDRALFKGKFRTFVLFLIVDFVAGMGLYTAAAFWAQLVRGVWQGDPIKVGILSLPGGLGGAVGGFAAGILIGKFKVTSTRMCLVYGTVMKTIADFSATLIQPTGPHSIPFGLGLGFLSMMGTGFTSVALIVAVQLTCEDRDIGLATLILGAVRAIGGSVAVTIYSAFINNVLAQDAGQKIATATLPLGLPTAALKPLVVALINENIQEANLIPGMTPAILMAARLALRGVWTKAFHRVYLTSGSFAALSVIAALWSKDVSQNMTDHVAVRLENEKAKVETIEAK